MQDAGIIGSADLAQGSTGVVIDPWDADRFLSRMDRHGIATALLQDYGSVDLVQGSAKREVARVTNEFFAKTALEHPGRFGSFASIPMPDVDGAVAEARFAIEELGLDGISLHSSYEGKYLGDAEFDPLFAELDRLEAVCFVHPVPPLGRDDLQLRFPVVVLDFPFDTTRAITNMFMCGTFERFPGVRIIFAHGCGAAPYLHGRLAAVFSMFDQVRPFSEHLADMDERFARLYYDTAGIMSSATWTMLQQVAPPSHIVFGSDCPPSPERFATCTIEAIANHAGLDDDARSAIERGNALELFPRLRNLP